MSEPIFDYKLVYGAQVWLICPYCQLNIKYTNSAPYGGDYDNFMESIREAMAAHRSDDPCVYRDERADKKIFSDQNVGQEIKEIGGWGRLLKFAKGVRMHERRRHRK